MNDKIARLIYLLAKACLLMEGMEELLINFAKVTIREINDELDNVINERENDDITYTREKYLDERYAVLTGLIGDLKEAIK